MRPPTGRPHRLPPSPPAKKGWRRRTRMIVLGTATSPLLLIGMLAFLMISSLFDGWKMGQILHGKIFGRPQ